MKCCSKCGQQKPLDRFAPDRSKRSGRDSWCRDCRNQARKGRYYGSHDREKKRGRAYYRNNRSAVLQRHAQQAAPEVLAERAAAARKKWAQMSPDERWVHELKRTHGMYPAQWEAMYMEQGGKCYLCLRPLPDDRRRIAVDHHHGHCGKERSCGVCRRGLACNACNAAIGLFGDDPERMRIAADNLERASAITQALIMSAPSQQALF